MQDKRTVRMGLGEGAKVAQEIKRNPVVAGA